MSMNSGIKSLSTTHPTSRTFLSAAPSHNRFKSIRYLMVCACCILLSGVIHAQCLDGDCENGRGTYQFENGSKYQGQFRIGKPQGKGTILFGNGNQYNGDWNAGIREGYGVYSFTTGNVYTGAFRKGKFSGKGSMTFASGHKYVGEWENDLPNGLGTYTFKTGERYEGSFRNGKFDGIGTMFYVNGERYVGGWKDNLKDGEGKFYEANGKVHSSKWTAGKVTIEDGGTDLTVSGNASTPTNETNAAANVQKIPDCNKTYCRAGIGQYTYGDGSRFVGEFKEGQPEGQGTCYYNNGDKYVGRWEKHAPHGEGIMYYTNGRVLGAIWEYGRPTGELPANNKAVTTIVEVDKDPAVKIWAVVVGVGRYTTMPNLKYPTTDAYQYYAFLKSPEGGALPDAQVKILVDEDATRANILQTMRQTLLRADDNDVIVFYFSGHGVEGSFLPVDYDGFNNKLLHSEIKDIMTESQAKHKLCIADACHSGTLLAMKSPAMSNVLQKYYAAFQDTHGGLALLMSSKAEEFSLEDQGLRSGIFSHYLLRGLKGEADTDGNKIVTIRELFDYVYKNVRTYTSSAQSPTLTGTHDDNMPVSVMRN